MDRHVAVVGGTGRTGRIIVRKLLERGEDVLAVARRAPVGADRLPVGAAFHAADVRDPRTLPQALGHCSALVYCVEPGTEEEGPDRPETTMHHGVVNVLAAATARSSRPHVVLVSQIHATHVGHPLNAYGRLLDWRRAGEDAVRDAGLPYTVVRSAWLTEDRSGGAVRLVQGDRETGRITPDGLAETCVQSLYCPSASGLTFEAFSAEPGATEGWEPQFASLRWDPAPAMSE